MSAEASPPTSTVPTNHPTGFWFFFTGEFAERSSYYGMRAILSLYMIEKLGVAKSDAGTYMSFFMAACYFFPLIGGWIADNFLGKYWTIVLFSAPYVLGQFLVGIENPWIVAGSLTLLAMGSGVIKPNISTLMGITYDQQRPGQEQLRTSAFNYFYMAINIGAFLSQFTMPLLRVNYGYQVAFIFPAVLMILALILFALGKRFYGKEVIIRTYIGSKSDVRPDSTTVTGIPVKYLPQTAEEIADDKALKIKTVSGIGALFLTVMFFWAIFDQSASTWIFFADTYMTESFLGFPLTADQVQSFNALFIVLLVPVFVLLFKICSAKGYPIKPTTKMFVGFGLTALSMFIMAFSASLAGPKSDQMKLTTPQGLLIVPLDDVKVDNVKANEDGSPVTIGGAVKVSSSDFKFNPDKKKLEMKNGTITAGSVTLTVKDGQLTGTIPDEKALIEAGMLEPRLKSESARKELADKLAKDPPAADKIAPITVESVEWTEPKTRVPVAWQIFAYFIITIAEILISVTGLELAFVAAPKSMKGFVTALWLAVVGCANLFINAPVTQLYSKTTPMNYFAGLGIAMVVVMVVYLPIAKKFNKTMAGKQPD